MVTESLIPKTAKPRNEKKGLNMSAATTTLPLEQKRTMTLEEEKNPWEAQAARFDLAAKKLKLDDGIWKVLRYPSREIIVHIPVQMDDGSIEVFTGYRVQHSIARGPGRAEYGMRRMYLWTRYGRWRVG